MKRIILTAACFILLPLFYMCSPGAKTGTIRTVDSLDIERYMGTWYEIARFDHKFERDLVGVTANYALMANGKINVVNKGYVDNLRGRYKTARGKGKMPNKKYPGRLKVSFFLWFYSDYLVIDVDHENYSYALVGGKDYNYLWILSRSPKMDAETKQMLVEKARNSGFDVSRLIWVEQFDN